MLSDGALRMLVLLHFNTLGFSPVQLAWLFLLYEVAGIVTNLAAGWLAARFGLAMTLYGGLVLQIAALIALSQLDPAWTVAASVAFVMAVQGVSGVAKDLAKMSSKSAVKLLAPHMTAAFSAGSRCSRGPRTRSRVSASSSARRSSRWQASPPPSGQWPPCWPPS